MSIYIYILEICKLVCINIRDLPAVTVAKSVERRRDKPKAFVRILASVRFFVCYVEFYYLFYLCKALEGSISSGFCIVELLIN